MEIKLTAGQALRLSYLLQVGKENTNQQDIKDVADAVEEQIKAYIEELAKVYENHQS